MRHSESESRDVAPGVKKLTEKVFGFQHASVRLWSQRVDLPLGLVEQMANLSGLTWVHTEILKGNEHVAWIST